jgi:hypothetical protein
MNGPEHFAKAELFMRYAAENDLGGPAERTALAAAQVHATLSLAAATAMAANPAGQMPQADWSAWHRAAATPKETGL